MDLRISVTNKKVQEILNKVSKADKRILVQEAILYLNDEILRGNTRSVVYDPNEVVEKTDDKENIQQEEYEKQVETIEEVENHDAKTNENEIELDFTLDF